MMTLAAPNQAPATVRSPTCRPRPVRPLRLTCAAVAAPSSPVDTSLSLHLGQTTVSFPFSSDSARILGRAFKSLLQSFSEKRKDASKRYEIMEFRMEGERELGEPAFLEVFCNPNAHASAFDAKMLVKLRTQDGLTVATEGLLTDFRADLQAFFEQHCK